jgi:hypothetical protein
MHPAGGILNTLPLLAGIPPLSRYAPPDDPCVARHGGAEESEQAFAQAVTHKETDYRRILAYVAGQGQHGATVEEISRALGLRYTTASARCAELKHGERPRLVKSGQRRATTSGSAAAVLVAKEFA